MNNPKSIPQKLYALIEKISSIGMWAAAAMVAVSVLLIVAETGNRIFFFANVSFAEEFTGYSLLFVCMMAAASAVKKGDFIRLYILTKRLSPRLQHISLAVSFGIGSVVLCIYLYEALVLIQESLLYSAISNTVFKTPLWIPQIFIVIGGTCMLLQIVAEMSRNIYFAIVNSNATKMDGSP